MKRINGMAEPNTNIITFEYRLRPNRKFVEACEQTLDAARFVYNCALEQRISHYRQSGESLSYFEQSGQLTEARRDLPDVRATLRSIQQDSLERLDLAFQAFFKRLKNPHVKAGFPRFKSRERYHTFSQKLEAGRVCPLKGDALSVPGVGTCRVRVTRPLEGRVKQLRITRRASGWYVLLVCKRELPEALPATGQSVGVDVGLTSFATLSTGEPIDNPRPLKLAQKKLKRAQRRLSSKQKGSANRRRARRRVALKHERVANTRKDFHHKVSHDLVKRFDTIAVESLNVRGMVSTHTLAQSISDAAWSQFFNITKAKAENAGRTFEKVDPRYTSQDCSRCGHRQRMPLSIRIFECGKCQHILDRDTNAAINILGRVAPEVTLAESDSTHRSKNSAKINSASDRTSQANLIRA